MKKLVIAAMALALSAGVNAQQGAQAAGMSGVVGAGGLTVATLTAIGVTAAVAAAIISNNSGATLVEGQEFELACKPGEGTLTGDVCTLNTSTVTTTGTGTATSTITVPVVQTFVPILVPRT